MESVDLLGPTWTALPMTVRRAVIPTESLPRLTEYFRV
jgi:hypothetical protein